MYFRFFFVLYLIGKSGLLYPGLTGPALVGKKMLSISEQKEDKAQSEAPPVVKKSRFPKIPALQVICTLIAIISQITKD